MFGVLYVSAQDCEGANVLVGYPACMLSTHCGAHGKANHGPARVEILVGRLKGRQFAPEFLEAGEIPSGSNQFVPLTDSPSPLYFGTGGTP